MDKAPVKNEYISPIKACLEQSDPVVAFKFYTLVSVHFLSLLKVAFLILICSSLSISARLASFAFRSCIRSMRVERIWFAAKYQAKGANSIAHAIRIIKIVFMVKIVLIVVYLLLFWHIQAALFRHSKPCFR